MRIRLLSAKGRLLRRAKAWQPPRGEASRDPEEYFAGHPVGLVVFAAVRDLVEGMGGAEVRTTKSQVAFRRRRGFAYLWPPGRFLARPGADVVLSVVLGRRDDDPRWKEVVHPAPAHWMHHLEVHDAAEIDAQVAGWPAEAYDRAD